MDGNFVGGIWIIGWLFTIGFLRLPFWKGVVALIIWPYYMGKKYTKEPAPISSPEMKS